MMSFWADHSLNAIDTTVSKCSGRNYTSRHIAWGKMTLPWKCIAMDTIKNNWLITSTRNVDSLLVLHFYHEEAAACGRPDADSNDLWMNRVQQAEKPSDCTIQYFKILLSNTKLFVGELTTPFVFSPLVHTASAYIFKIGSFHSAYYKAA